jgi:hypothetical protein
VKNVRSEGMMAIGFEEEKVFPRCRTEERTCQKPCQKEPWQRNEQQPVANAENNPKPHFSNCKT